MPDSTILHSDVIVGIDAATTTVSCGLLLAFMPKLRHGQKLRPSATFVKISNGTEASVRAILQWALMVCKSSLTQIPPLSLVGLAPNTIIELHRAAEELGIPFTTINIRDGCIEADSNGAHKLHGGIFLRLWHQAINTYPFIVRQLSHMLPTFLQQCTYGELKIMWEVAHEVNLSKLWNPIRLNIERHVYILRKDQNISLGEATDGITWMSKNALKFGGGLQPCGRHCIQVCAKAIWLNRWEQQALSRLTNEIKAALQAQLKFWDGSTVHNRGLDLKDSNQFPSLQDAAGF